MDGGTERRGRRAVTKTALQKAALERFRANGFAQTSVAEIAADAGVTERTFYRYFPSKEAVLFQDYESRLEWFHAALAVRPEREAVLDSVRVAVESFPDDRDLLHQVAALRDTVLSRDQIEEHLQRVQGVVSREIEAHLMGRFEDRPDGELAAAVLGRTISSALFAALEVWTRRGGDGSLEDLSRLVARAFELLREGLDEGVMPPASRRTARGAARPSRAR